MKSQLWSSFVYTPCIASAEIALLNNGCGLREWVWFKYSWDASAYAPEQPI
jgi:hypothetical protein